MNRICITLPAELQCYRKTTAEASEAPKRTFDAGISVIKDSCGRIERVDYYTSNGELLKRVIYNGSSIVGIQNYRNGQLYTTEDYKENLLCAKTTYNKQEQVISKIYYEYNRENHLTGIRKIQDYSQYRIQYGYDELGRVNSRKIWVNTDVIEEQKYKYDILDRVVEYQDKNQSIRVHQISSKNELVSYTITDRIGNEISIHNQFLANQYQKTEILLNGHSMTLKDKSYMDNIMLKKPYITEDDLELAIYNILKPEQENNDIPVQRTSTTDTTNTIINKNVETITLPISMRKSNFGNITFRTHSFTNA